MSSLNMVRWGHVLVTGALLRVWYCTNLLSQSFSFFLHTAFTCVWKLPAAKSPVRTTPGYSHPVQTDTLAWSNSRKSSFFLFSSCQNQTESIDHEVIAHNSKIQKLCKVTSGGIKTFLVMYGSCHVTYS